MRKTILLISFLIYSIYAFGQDPNGLDYEFLGIKYWSQGKQTEEDFQSRKVSDLVKDSSDKIPGELDWTIGFEPETVKIGNLILQYTKSETYMDQIQSWINQEVPTRQALEYFQTEFNIVEAFRRKLQDQLNSSPAQYRYIRDYNYRLLTSAIDAFRMETAYGYDALALAKYQLKYEQELDSWEETPLSEPGIPNKGYGIRFYAGYNSMIFGNGLSQYMGPSHGMIVGYEFLLRGISIGGSMSIGSAGQLKEDNFYYDSRRDYQWRKGVNCSNGLVMLYLGYNILDKPVFSIRPEAGIGVHFIDQKLPDELKTKDNSNSELASFIVQAGMNFNVKLRRKMSVAYGGYSYGETSLTFKVFGARSMFKEIGPINSINLGVCFDFGLMTDSLGSLM